MHSHAGIQVGDFDVVFLHIYFAIGLLSDTSMDDVQLN